MAKTSFRCFLLLLVSQAWAFLPAHPAGNSLHVTPTSSTHPQAFADSSRILSPNHRLQNLPRSVRVQRKSFAPIQTAGLFGLGLGEIGVILVVVGLVLGPQNLGRVVSASSTRAQELAEGAKKVPEEFQKGMEEGESDARSRKAKRIKVIKPGDEGFDE